MQWVPAQTYAAWPGKGMFVAGNIYTGMPYTQNSFQSDLNDFYYALNNSSATKFYKNLYPDDPEKTMPRYGNDCSGFVSICWGKGGSPYGRNRWNTSDFKKAIEDGIIKKVAYQDLKQGDALLKQGHIMLVRYVSNGTISVYEQTGLTAHESVHSFLELDSSSYEGISMFK